MRVAVVDSYPLDSSRIEGGVQSGVTIHRPVDGPIPIRYVGNTMIISLLEEVLVLEKQLMLKEELHINTRQVETSQPQPVTLRSEEAIIKPIDNHKERR